MRLAARLPGMTKFQQPDTLHRKGRRQLMVRNNIISIARYFAINSPPKLQRTPPSCYCLLVHILERNFQLPCSRVNRSNNQQARLIHTMSCTAAPSTLAFISPCNYFPYRRASWHGENWRDWHFSRSGPSDLYHSWLLELWALNVTIFGALTHDNETNRTTIHAIRLITERILITIYSRILITETTSHVSWHGEISRDWHFSRRSSGTPYLYQSWASRASSTWMSQFCRSEKRHLN